MSCDPSPSNWRPARIRNRDRRPAVVSLGRDPDLSQAAHYLEELTVTAKEGKLKGFELVKMVHLDDQQFSIEV